MNPHDIGCAEIRNADTVAKLRKVILWALIIFLASIAGMAAWHRFGPYLRGDEPHTVTTNGQ